ncbi:MAG: hypothetical protein NTW95_08885 [Candidatus Aminicenantes bacterium]|nr:hypothetical protein [Candidatus Aminicenantes bacterium]
MRKHDVLSVRPRMAAVVVLLVFTTIAGGRLAFAQVTKQDFFGTWAMNHDGWEGTLVLRAAGIPGGLFGDYLAADGKVHFVQGSVEAHKIVFYVDLKDTKGLPEDDQRFEGYLFTQSRQAMAGTTTWANIVYGWSAAKTSAATNLPAAPVVSSDFPDPAKNEPQESPVVVASSGEFRLSTTKEEYAPGEAVGFELNNTQVKTIDLSGFYYIIGRSDGDKYKEFYTSAKEPFAGVKLKTGEKRAWFWDQWDNERLAKAQPGNWRIRFFAPAALDKPFIVHFKIKNP